MIFADERGLIAMRGEDRGKGREFRNRVPAFGPVVAQPVVYPGVDAVLRGHQTGHNRSAARRAHAVDAKSIVELEAFGGQSVDMRRADFVVAIAAEQLSRLVVGHEDQDVGVLFHARSMAD